MRLAAEVYVAGKPLQTVELAPLGPFRGTYVMLTTRHHDQFNFMMWGKTYNQTLRPYMAQVLSDVGVTAQLAPTADWEASAGGLSWVAYATGIRYALKDDGLPERGSWNDDEAMNKWVQEVVGKTQPAREMGALIYSLGDENDTFGADKSEYDLAAYRKYLAKVYPSIKELNENWGSSFESFDKVILSDPDDLTEATALREKNYPRWWDRRAYMRYNYAMLCDRFLKAFDKVDPGARVGFEGAGWMEDDIDLLTKVTTFWGPYSHLAMQVVSSITPPDYIAGAWSGASWPLALHGGRQFGWFRVDNEGAVHVSFLGPDMALRPMHQERLGGMQIWLHGLGTALMHWDRQDDGIVMLYSFPSSNATHLEPGRSYGGMGFGMGEETDYNHWAWHRNLRASGVQFRYVTEGMLDRGEWDGSSDKLLILSQIEALSPGQVNAIRQFVEKGGTVIADVRPGLYSNHMKPQREGLLDDLFGVRHARNAAAEKRTMGFKGKLGRRGISGTVADVEVNPGVEFAGADALGGAGNTPVMFINKVGKGKAILLNFTMRSFPWLDSTSAPKDAGMTFDALLAAASVKPQIEVTDEAGERQRDIEVVRWRDGEREVLALYRPAGENAKDHMVVCRLSEPQVVTNLRTGACVKATGQYYTTIRPDEATFLLLSADEPLTPEVSMPKTVARGETVKVAVKLDGPKYRCLRLAATGPDGKDVRAFRRVEKVQDKTVTLDVPIALNEALGEWTLSLTDATTGRSAEARFTVH